MIARPLRIAILAHSTNPRGGVVHALALGDVLTTLGHTAVVHAPDHAGTGFFRETLCETVSVPASRPGPDTTAMVEERVADYLRYFEKPKHRGFDIFHAQDGLSGTALITLKTRGFIEDSVRTVHHLDNFADPRLHALQHRALVQADLHVVVSPMWREKLAADYGIEATVVGNGVDRLRYSPMRDGREADLRRQWGIGAGPVFLSIGGVEERKNTIRVLAAFGLVRSVNPGAQLIIAGGSSLLDHAVYQSGFAEALEAADLPPGAVIRTGPVPDADMPALYRVADALVFPSLKEGFGLVVLEAMASGLPVVTARIAPFTGYLDEADAAWCSPTDVGSIAAAMMEVLGPAERERLRGRGAAVAARHDWLDTARAHLPVYARARVLAHA